MHDLLDFLWTLPQGITMKGSVTREELWGEDHDGGPSRIHSNQVTKKRLWWL